ncbi:MAG: hypothetical protein JNM27_03265 [Leptospirales bacterium]|nr:hypothetical protein [Leptospirales bacterium]
MFSDPMVQAKIFTVGLVILCYALIMSSFFHSLNLVKRAHHVNLKEVKNEVPNGFLVRTLCSIVYYFCLVDWIAGLGLIPWAYVPYSEIRNTIGAILIVLVTGLFWWVSIALGSNYHGPMKLHPDHKLVMTGPYSFMRHPTYTAFPLFHLSLFLLTNNYLLLLAGLAMSVYTNHKENPG